MNAWTAGIAGCLIAAATSTRAESAAGEGGTPPAVILWQLETGG